MICRILCFSLLFLHHFLVGQITIIGHNKLNNEELEGVEISITENGNLLSTINVEKGSDFKIKLDYNKYYKLYFKHPKCIEMFAIVDSRNIPEDKQVIKMIHELDVPFFYSDDSDVNHETFNEAFQQIFFDGKSKMITDTAYVSRFYAKVIKPKNIKNENITANSKQESPVIFCGYVNLNNDPKLKVNLKGVKLFAKNGRILKETRTDRFGRFVAGNILLSELDKIELTCFDGSIKNNAIVHISNEERNYSIKTTLASGKATWVLSEIDKPKFINNDFTSNIGGKLILTNNGKKSFYAGKTVYLSNKRNTVIDKTTTNLFGGFVFDNIKPEQQYYVGVDAKEIGANDKLDLLNKDDQYGVTLDVTGAGRISTPVVSDDNNQFNLIVIGNDEMKMNVNAKIYGDDLAKPIGKTKILLLNDAYEVIDSTISDDLGAFKFKYLPYLKRFFLSAENANNSLDVFKNILVYSEEDQLVKIMTHIKGSKFVYKPIASDVNKVRKLELDDPWLELGLDLGKKKKGEETIIMEPILFETNKFQIPNSATSTLDKIVKILNSKPAIKIEIRAHTDCIGNDASNMKLSEQRAKSVLNYILAKGISSSRLTAKGYGETKLLNKCKNGAECSDIEHAINRRVEFLIK
ncbi:MAG: OmpA family protein [Bacteroidia bacterium]